MTAIASVLPTGDTAINGVLYGVKWAATSLTFSFPSSGAFYGSGYGSNENITGFAVFNPAQQSAVRSILTSYASVIDFSFTEITETSSQHAELRYATSTLPSTAWAYLPTPLAEGGDAWFGVTNNWYVNPVLGNYAWLTFIHETGHALGLKHPHAAAGAFGVMPTAFDSLEYTVMSYRSYVGGPATGYTVEGYGFPQTLMMYDVAALQEMYGANYTTNSGDTVYKWDPLTGQQFINGIGQTPPGANRILMNVWDGGGRDTYDFSNYTNPVTNLKIDLSPGGWTTTSTAQLSTLAAGHIATGNISNSLLYHGNTASLIEDAIGGAGNDIITGNEANNRLTGGAGGDTLDGKGGIDRAVYSGFTSNYQLVHNVNGSWTVTDLRGGSPDGTDTLTDIELIQFSNELILLGTMQAVPPLQVPTFSGFGDDSGTPGDRITNDNTLTFTGAGTAGSIVSLFRSGALLGTAEVDSFGAWTFATAALADGTHSFTANATNVAGDASATSAAYVITIDRTAPNTPTIVGYTPDSHILGDGKTRFATLTLNGSAEANSLVHIFDGATLLGTTTATAGGTWNFTTYDPALAAPSLACACPACAAAMGAASGPTAQNGDGITGVLSDGGHAFTVRAADIAGNLSAASAALNVTIDTAAPATPSILMFSPDSGILGDGKTKIQVLTLSGTAEALSTVEVYDGTTLLGTATASGGGSWTYYTPTLAYGVHSFTAKAVDDAGNTSATSTTLAVTVDPNAPNAVNSAPVVNAVNVNAVRGQSLAASTLFSATDVDYDVITSYRLYDLNAAANSGYFAVNGVAKAGATITTVTPEQLLQTTLVAGAGAESILVAAFDGTVWSAWKTFTVTTPNAAPVVAASGAPVYRNQTVTASSLFSVTDADNDAITQYQIWDGTVTATSGYFVVNGVVQPAASAVISLTPAQLSQTSFVAGTTSDTVMVRAIDGATWGNWTSFSVAPVNRAPVVTATNVSASPGQSLAASSLFAATDPDGDAVTQYQFQDITTGATSGYFTVTGTAQAATTIFTVTTAQLSQTNFIAGAVGDTLMVRAYDGTTWSGWSTFNVSAANSPPVVTASDVFAVRNQSLTAASLFSATDPENQPIAQYQFQDGTAGATSGYFAINGVTQPAGSAFTITSAQLAQTTFVAGAAVDTITVRAFDGVAWSNWTTFSVTGSNAAPTVTASNVTAAPNQLLAATSLFSVSDGDNDPIAQYQFQDSTSGAGSGYFTVNGVAQAAATPIDVTAAQLSQTNFVVGSASDTLMVRASDGITWGAWATFSITPSNPNTAPVVTTANLTAGRNQSLAVSTLFSVSDANNDVMTQYQFQDSTTGATSGSFAINGVAQPAATPITVAAGQLAQTSFVVGSVADSLMVRAFDGLSWSGWSTFSVTPINIAPIVTASNMTVARNQSLAASSLFSVSDANSDAITQFQLWDSNSAATSGHFVVNGTPQTTGAILTLSPSQLTQTSFLAGAAPDTIMIRAHDGLTWGAWATFTVSTPNNLAVVTATPVTASTGQNVAVTSLFTATDPDSDTITQYQFYDGTVGASSGYFTVNGVAQTASTTIVTATIAQLPQISFVAGTIADNIIARAFDGAGWGAWTALKVTVAASGSVAAGSDPAITGTAANDTLASTSAGEVMIGGAGGDTFVFASNFGKDTVKDFQTGGPSHDSLQFSHGVFSDVADILAHATQNGSDVVIAADAENSVTLQNVTLSVLQQHQNDLLFIV